MTKEKRITIGDLQAICDQIDERFKGVEERLNTFYRQFDKMDEDLETVDFHVQSVKSDLAGHFDLVMERFRSDFLSAQHERVEGLKDAKTHHELRIGLLERKVENMPV